MIRSNFARPQGNTEPCTLGCLPTPAGSNSYIVDRTTRVDSRVPIQETRGVLTVDDDPDDLADMVLVRLVGLPAPAFSGS